MGTVSTLLDQLPHEAGSERDHQAEFSLMLRHSQSREGVEVALREAAGGHVHELYPAFQGELREETNDRFWILRFPEREILGHEATAFGLAAVGVGLSPALATELAAKPRLQDLLR